MSHLPVLDFHVRSNENFYSEVILEDSDGEPFPMEGLGWEMHVRETAASKTVVFPLTTENGRIAVLEGSKLAFSWSEEDISNLPRRGYVHDLRARQGGSRTVVAVGRFAVDQGVTRKGAK